MFRSRLLARLVVPVVLATTVQALVAGEPEGTTPPAKSIREWKANPTTTPSGEAVAAPATSIYEWKRNPDAAPAAGAPAPPARSIREWRAGTPTAAAATMPCAVAPGLPALPATTAAAGAAVTKSPITISIKSALRQGNLVVTLDGVPIFNEKFEKPVLLFTQTTTWDPLQIPAGTHRLAAKVHGAKKTYSSKLYDLHVSRTKGNTLRFVLQGDKLTVELAS